MHPLKICYPLFISIFMWLYNHHHNLIVFLSPQKKPHTHYQSVLIPHFPPPDHKQSLTYFFIFINLLVQGIRYKWNHTIRVLLVTSFIQHTDLKVHLCCSMVNVLFLLLLNTFALYRLTTFYLSFDS